jgi:hypothetical protein
MGDFQGPTVNLPVYPRNIPIIDHSWVKKCQDSGTTSAADICRPGFQWAFPWFHPEAAGSAGFSPWRS